MLVIDLLSLNTESAKYVALGHLSRLQKTTEEVVVLAVINNRERIDREIGNKNWKIIYLPSTFSRLVPRALAVYSAAIILRVRKRHFRILNFSGFFFPLISRQTSLAQNPLPLLIKSLKMKVGFGARVKNYVIRRLIVSVSPTENRRMIFNSKHLRSIYDSGTRYSFNEPVLYQGVGSAHFVVEGVVAEHKSSVILLSTITRHKRTLESLKLLYSLVEMGALPSGVCVNIVGKIDDVRYKNEIDALTVQNSCYFVPKWYGFVSSAQKADLLLQAKYYISLSACESFGIPLVEAQSAGVIPIIAAGTAQEEIAGDGALVFDESSGSLQAIADTMRDTDTQIRLVSLAKENAKRFDWSAIYHNAESPFA